MMKIILSTFLILFFYSNTANAFTCRINSNGFIIPIQGTGVIQVPIEATLVQAPPNVINSFASLNDYVTCINDNPTVYTDYFEMRSFISLKPNPNIEFGVQINGANYFNQLPAPVRVLTLAQGSSNTSPLPLKAIMRVKNVPKDGLFIRKGDQIMRMEMHKWAHNFQSGNTRENEWDYTWIIAATNDIIITSGTCDINNNQDVIVDLGDLYSRTIPSTSGTMTYGKDVPIDYQCADNNYNSQVSIYINATVSSFSPSAILTRKGLSYGAGATIPNLGVEIYNKKSTTPMKPNVKEGGFTTQIVNGRGNDTLYIAPIKSSSAVEIAEGYFNAVATLVMTSP